MDDGASRDSLTSGYSRWQVEPCRDYLSRKGNVEIDPDFSREDKFEDNIFSTQSVNSLQRKKDPVIRRAIEHMKGDYGLLKKVSDHLQILEVTLFSTNGL